MRREGEKRGLDLDVQHLAAAVHPVVWVDAVRAESTAVGRIFCDLRSFESVSGAAISAAAFRLLAFRVSHGRSFLECGRRCVTRLLRV